MKILMAPMAALAETSGPIGRARALAFEPKGRGHEVAFCAAEDGNYRPVEGVKNYRAPLPSPFGLPLFVGKRIIRIAQALPLQRRMMVTSFEKVLHMVGAIDKRFFPKDVYYLREAIRDFNPDVVYAEFRIAAIVAAKLENVRVVTGYSLPVQKSYASNPEYSKGVRGFLRRNNLPEIASVLDMFDWADLKIVPSSYELEPIDDRKVIHVGPLTPFPRPKETSNQRKSIVAYMGSGSITPRELVEVLTEAFLGTSFQVWIAARGLYLERDNIKVASRFDFDKLMPEAVTFINHGGQNSIMTGLIYGVPQIICRGNVFERQYNATSIERLNAGISLDVEEFIPQRITEIVQEFERNPVYAGKAKEIGEKLLNLGGVSRVLDILEGRSGW